jgi:diguanylate cyclase (GGDEF)-like protein/PAS domain S-box-containing protein
MKRNQMWQGTDYDRFVMRPDETDLLWESDAMQKILIIDDEARVRQSLYELLQYNNYECWAVESGEEAKDLLVECRFDLLLLDLNMPGMSGHDIMQLVNELEHRPAVVVLSGETSFDHAARALRGGATDFLRKPYQPQMLLRTIENVLEKRRLLKANRQMQERLSASEQLHRFIVNNSPDIIYMLDVQGRFTFVNERIESMLGYPHHELLGKHYAEVIHNEDVPKATWAFNERRTAERATHNLELRLKRFEAPEQKPQADSRPICIELSSMGVYQRGGDNEERFVGTYGVVRDVSERKQAQQLIEFQLYHDLLTRLPNRALFRDRLGQAISQAKRAGSLLAVMFIDLDRFKTVNDTLGHLVGDELLQAVAERLKSCLREGDTLARIGGDEFTLLLPSIHHRQDAVTIAEKVNNTLAQPFELGGRPLYVTASVGIAIYPDDGVSLDSLVGNSDMAMYKVKSRGRNGYAFFNAEMKTPYLRQLDFGNSLRQGIARNELTVFYQPLISLEENEILGVEALVRWRHPDNGLLMPGDFMPQAEEYGLLSDLSAAVLHRACRDYMHWWEQAIAPPRLAINLPGSLLGREDLGDWVAGIIGAYELPFGTLEVEVTEDSIMQDMESVVRRLTQLHQSHGVRVTVDDFGAGISNLGYLQALPAHNLKLDRSFLEKIQGSTREDAIVEAIVNLAKGLKLELIAEGVETQQQLDYLVKLKCVVGQGFFFSKPIPFEEMTGLLRNWPQLPDRRH